MNFRKKDKYMITKQFNFIWTPIFILLGLVIGPGCTSQATNQGTITPEQNIERPIVDDKYRLKEDRQKFDEIRNEIPVDKKNENDELAFVLKLMGEVKLPPGQIREKFNTVVRKKRELFNKDMAKRRETFVKAERKEKESFNKQIETERKELQKKKMASDERREAYQEIDQKRKDFYTALREKRDSFESDIRDDRKNFEDYMREKNQDFTQELRAYTGRYDEMKKQERELKKQKESEQKNSNKESVEIKKVVPLQSGQEE